jgi:hypothetical protein
VAVTPPLPDLEALVGMSYASRLPRSFAGWSPSFVAEQLNGHLAPASSMTVDEGSRLGWAR